MIKKILIVITIFLCLYASTLIVEFLSYIFAFDAIILIGVFTAIIIFISGYRIYSPKEKYTILYAGLLCGIATALVISREFYLLHQNNIGEHLVDVAYAFSETFVIGAFGAWVKKKTTK